MGEYVVVWEVYGDCGGYAAFATKELAEAQTVISPVDSISKAKIFLSANEIAALKLGLPVFD
jgi:hypothetical protein